MEPTTPVQVNYASRKPRILLAASGSVAAIKFANLCHCFSEWADVKAVATKASLQFIDKVSFPKDVDLYTDDHEWAVWKKIAGGLCDNLLTCIVRAWDYKKPFFVAPAMNTFMWYNSFTERHLMTIDELGISLIPPVSTRLASGDYANGAMAEPSHIFSTVRLFVESRSQPGGSRTMS
ncbi:phosphopantothenoylcysteine decarboxylase-like isoform X2 [Solanum dulcamara]|uniref:phosphopantothenoylcysteine decarboxylase-like isoform X2 n=1 Tax=Solanum dulcamara TaxID=45834 RepID=UPI002484FAE1|nr:phosphopantothenoylcysteine decarboxylase-like isoform X2 [Solanum dulcamara]